MEPTESFTNIGTRVAATSTEGSMESFTNIGTRVAATSTEGSMEAFTNIATRVARTIEQGRFFAAVPWRCTGTDAKRTPPPL